ncbi:hypothetical protein ABEB36_012250 [Hypothenemus hampei]|uniref:Nose resistant-to-fluoxetine protein N-terminal domain-containing protein n=1 Tax=Hypothenemus hampei TaxID=57062 RepID=A0ABD1ED90_HYPHA
MISYPKYLIFFCVLCPTLTVRRISLFDEFLNTLKLKQLSGTDDPECVSQYQLFYDNLLKNSTDKDNWALQMVDASAKPPAGILELNFIWMGNYDQCLKINSPTSKVKGKYCLATLFANSDDLNETEEELKTLRVYLESVKDGDLSSLLSSLFSIGLCVPDQCTDSFIQKVLKDVLTVSWNVTCQTKEQLDEPLDGGAIAVICFFVFFALLIALSTSYDLWAIHQNNQKSTSILKAFSLRINASALFKISENPGDLPCLHGLRFISMLWVILGHTFFAYCYGPVVNLPELFRFLYKETLGMIIVNIQFAVDTFFVISGMLTVLVSMRSLQKNKFSVWKFYLIRYLRLTPALIPVVLFAIFLTKYLGSGPFYPQINDAVAEPCRSNWWSVFYLQNYINNFDTCIPQMWYLDVDWQMHIISPLFLLFLPKRPKIGLLIMLIICVVSMGLSYYITWHYQLVTNFANFFGNTVDFYKRYYVKTHTRCSTWIIGGFLGYYLAKTEKRNYSIKLNKYVVAVSWLAAFAVLISCIFLGQDVLMDSQYHPYSNALYNTFARPAWALGICWVIYACCVGYGGIINLILSWPVFQVLNRFSYCMYILHVTLLFCITLILRVPRYFSIFNLIYSFWGIIAFSFFTSIIWILMFERPATTLERKLLR